MPRKPLSTLSPRERQIMEALYRLGEGSVGDVLNLVPDAPSYDTIRLTLGVLQQKGQVTHRVEGRRYIYSPTVSAAAASRSEMKQLLRTYYKGSPRAAVLALLDATSERLSDQELDEIADWIRQAREDRDD